MNHQIKKIILIAPICIAILSIWQWVNIGIYPDEIAYRVQLWRYIQDSGIVYGLYSLCESRIQETPIVFFLPAIFLSVFDLLTTPEVARYIYAAFFSVYIYCFYILGKHKTEPTSTWPISLISIGVASSSLVMVRYEAGILANLLFCTITLISTWGDRPSKKNIFYLILSVFFGTLLSLYTHVQGLLYIPIAFISVLFATRSLSWPTPRVRFAVFALIFIFLGFSSFNFHKMSCENQPLILEFWESMTISSGSLTDGNLSAFFIDSIEKYTNSFIYKTSYQANYLPSVEQSTGIDIINSFIIAALVGLLAINIILNLKACYTLTLYFVKTTAKRNKGLWPNLFYLSYSAPAILLIFIDTQHNFYRSIFINFILATSLIFYTNGNTWRLEKSITRALWILCLLLSSASIFSNQYLILEKLSKHVGPSVSFDFSRNGLNADIDSLVRECSISLNGKTTIVDDLTYNSFKNSQRVFPITYLSLQSTITSIPIAEVIRRANPDFVISRCSYMESTKIGWPAQARANDLCCLNFLMKP